VDERLRELSLFTGIGGGLLGSLLLGWRTVAAVECDAYCRRLLCERGGYVADAVGRGCGTDGQHGGLAGLDGEPPHDGVSAQECDSFPVYPDVRTFDAAAWRGKVDIITGGFPCQPHSQAGKRLGGLDERDLWPDTVRVLRESGAGLGFFENVPGLLTSTDDRRLPMFGRILGDLSEAGFDAEWCVLGADDVGAPHRRKRLWILAYRPGPRSAHLREVQAGRELAGWDTVDSGGDGVGVSPWQRDPADVGDANEPRPQGHGRLHERGGELPAGQDGAAEYDDWLAQPRVDRVAHGVPSRVDRLRGLGNAQVPQCMAAAFTFLASEAGLFSR